MYYIIGTIADGQRPTDVNISFNTERIVEVDNSQFLKNNVHVDEWKYYSWKA
jgi:hypothetical protein